MCSGLNESGSHRLVFGPQLVELLEGLGSVTLLKDLCIRVSWLGFFKTGSLCSLGCIGIQKPTTLPVSSLCLMLVD